MPYGFDLIKSQNIPELNTKATLYRHTVTGAQLLSLENDDENKVFGINFCTLPQDSSGVAHIMEHSVLCGSQKYPVKEPFVELIKGSLKTFVNAMTFPDKTCYPLASQNTQDLYNLIDVYMDAVLFPRLTPHILQQEGWHYELESADAPLIYKGVVFNEMKGNYSSPDGVLGEAIQQSLLPDTIYGVDSGGSPRNIPGLTYDQFKTFHDTYYHPSNALIFFYGDDDPQERLRKMQGYLESFQARAVDTTIRLQPRFSEPKRVIKPYPAGDDAESQKSMVTVNWMLDKTPDAVTMLALDVLDHILIGTPAAPLRKTLIESGLGEDLAGSGLTSEIREVSFSTGLKGVDAENIDQVEALVLQTLKELAEQGLDPDLIAASMNTLEFQLRELNTGSFPKGIVLMLTALTTWLYGEDPLDRIAFEKPLTALKEQIKTDKRTFESLIEKYLLNNTHRVTVILNPEPDLSQREEADEKQRLATIRAAMTPDDVQHIIEETRLLKQIQETPDSPEALATIPSLQLDDLEKQSRTIPITLLQEHGSKILYHDLFTNGIVYLDLGFNLHLLPQQYLPYVPLLGRALTEMGTQTQDFVQLSHRIGSKTGGIHPTQFTSAVRGGNEGLAWLFLRGKGTVAQFDDVLAILKDVLLTVNFNNQERFRQIVLEEKAGEEAGLVPAGHSVATTRLRSHFDEADWAAEQMGGVSYLFFLRGLAEQIEKDWPSVQAELEDMRRLLVNRRRMLSNVTLDAQNWQKTQPKLADFLSQLPEGDESSSTIPDRWTPTLSPVSEGLTMPAQVNYVAKGAPLYKLGYQLDGSIAVITNYLRTTWLWEKVRVQGGAYGGFCLFDRQSGVFNFVSYRDPNLAATLNIYDASSQFLRDSKLSAEELTRNIIGVIGQLDSYQLPDAKGYTSMVRYLIGETDDQRQGFRDQVLTTTADDFTAFADILDKVGSEGSVVVVGSSDAIEAAGKDRPNWLQISKIL